jgi:hypothetical protein
LVLERDLADDAHRATNPFRRILNLLHRRM